MKNNDSRIKELQKKLNEQRKSLGTKPRFAQKTNYKFHYDLNTHVNLNVCDKSEIIEALTFLLSKYEYHKKACELLECEEEFVYYGYSFQSWLDDFKDCIKIKEWYERDKKLKATEKQLNNLLSEEGKTANILDDIESLLG